MAKLHSIVGLITNSSSVVYSFFRNKEEIIKMLSTLFSFFNVEFSLDNYDIVSSEGYIEKVVAIELFWDQWSEWTEEDPEDIIQTFLKEKNIEYKNLNKYEEYVNELYDLLLEDKDYEGQVLDWCEDENQNPKYFLINKTTGEKLDLSEVVIGSIGSESVYQ